MYEAHIINELLEKRDQNTDANILDCSKKILWKYEFSIWTISILNQKICEQILERNQRYLLRKRKKIDAKFIFLNFLNDDKDKSEKFNLIIATQKAVLEIIRGNW